MHVNISTLLDVAIGLIFIFFVFSVFVSGIVELLNSLMEERAKLLRMAIDKLLGATLSSVFFSHKLTVVKHQRFWGFMKPINYLSADSFSTVLIDMMAKVGQPNAVPKTTDQTLDAIRNALQTTTLRDIRDLIEPILAKSNNFQAFKAELDRWYNGYMEQVSGWYKRYAQGVVWLVSAAITLVFNVDTVHLTDRLYNDNGLRERVVAEAIQTAETGQLTTGKADTAFVSYLKKGNRSLLNKTEDSIRTDLVGSEKMVMQSAYVQFVQSRVQDLQLPISWRRADNWLGWGLQPGQAWGWTIVGWLLTVAALSFGAPFWFDLLLKLVNIRNTARRPPGNPEPK